MGPRVDCQSLQWEKEACMSCYVKAHLPKDYAPPSNGLGRALLALDDQHIEMRLSYATS
jgi:hypothetical protein